MPRVVEFLTGFYKVVGQDANPKAQVGSVWPYLFSLCRSVCVRVLSLS